jgi:UDP-2,3-diacylglucosamine hydrolase
VTTLFISDLHLARERPRSTELFLNFLKTQANRADALYILGDLFEFWIGDDAATDIGHRAIIDALRHLNDGGVPTQFIPGNRDFLVGEQFSVETGCVLLADPSVIDLYGERVLLMHGDSLCTDDHAHQRFRALVNQSSWRKDFLAKPMEERFRLATDARAQSEFNKSLLTMDIMDVNQIAVESVMRDYGVQTLIHGHTHRPAIHQFRLDGTQVRRIVLGDWYEQSSVLRYSPHEVSLSPEVPRS